MRYARLAALCLTLVSCTTFHEVHYFKSPPTGPPTNYFRLQVDGCSFLGKTRYLAGYYDERAVDLYFNEVASQTTDGHGDQDIRPLFVVGQKEPGTEDVIRPLSPGTHGAFLMIFSSNPNVVADVIGQFAESQQVADSLTHLLNRDAFRKAQASTAQDTVEAAKHSDQAAALATLFDGIPAAGPPVPSKTELERQYLRILENLAATLGRPQGFRDIRDAANWFSERRPAAPEVR